MPSRPVEYPVQPIGGFPRHLWPAVFLGIVGAFALFTDAVNLPVTAPLAIGALTATVFFWALWCRRHTMMPWFEIGAVYVTVVTLYTAYPLIAFLALGQTYGAYNDLRLAQIEPTAQDVGRIGWLYVWHLSAFVLTYLITRGRTRIPSRAMRRPGVPVFLAVIAGYVAIESFMIFLGLFYDTTSTTYAGTYLAARRLPLLLAQFFNHLDGIRYVLSVMLLAALFSIYPRSRLIIGAWIAFAGAVTVAGLGSRTEFVLLVLSAAMMYHMVVRPISPRVMVTAATAGLVAFVAFGIVRNGVANVGGVFARNPFAYTNEFESLFANSVHLDRVRHSIGALPLAFYFSDFAALIPQQLAPFTKVDRADWYVATFFPQYAALGGGLAFGTIAESVLTGGWMSALGRGMVLGFCFARLHRFYVRQSDRFWVLVFYVWVTVLCYQVFRNGTFAILVLIAFRFLPALLAVNLLARGITQARGPARPHALQASPAPR